MKIRKAIAVMVGVIVGIVVVTLVEGISSKLYPPPADLVASDIDALRQHISTLPRAAFFIVLAAHAIGTLAAGFVCAAVSKNQLWWGPIFVGAILLAGGIANLVMIPHPIWFAIVDVAVYLPAAYLGGVISNSIFPSQKGNRTMT